MPGHHDVRAENVDLKRLGAVIIDPADLPSQGKLGEHELERTHEARGAREAVIGGWQHPVNPHRPNVLGVAVPYAEFKFPLKLKAV